MFNLIAQADTEASINLAALAQRDGSNMKTIAVMTMMFLPGTFFAALFAVPSLKWDAGVVISDRFWIYWAFALPSTALIILLWWTITNWKTISKRIIPNADPTFRSFVKGLIRQRRRLRLPTHEFRRRPVFRKTKSFSTTRNQRNVSFVVSVAFRC